MCILDLICRCCDHGCDCCYKKTPLPLAKLLKDVENYFGSVSVEFLELNKFQDEWNRGWAPNQIIVKEIERRNASLNVVLGELQKIYDALKAKVKSDPNNYDSFRSSILKLDKGTSVGLYYYFKQKQPEHCGIASTPPTALVYPAASVQPTQVLPRATPPQPLVMNRK